jgi:Co/Zn/Cd efflux system component
LAARPTTVSTNITGSVRMEAAPIACIWACVYVLIAVAVYGAMHLIGSVPVPPRGVVLVATTAFLVSFVFAFAMHSNEDMHRYRQAVRKRLVEAYPVSPC